MMAWGMIGFAVLVAVVLAVAFAAISARYSAEKPKNDEKLKRDTHSRLMLGDDGELVEVTDDEPQYKRDSF